MGYLISWLTIPLKVLAITILAIYHKWSLHRKYGIIVVGDREPSALMLAQAYRDLRSYLDEQLVVGSTGKLLYDVNPDHQALRHGSLTWAVPEIGIIEGMENYIDGENFLRGPKSTHWAPSAPPMSIAHAVATAYTQDITLSEEFKNKFLFSVDALIKRDFAQAEDVRTTPRLASTGFDAIFALSMLYAAYYLSDDKKYLTEANKILYLKGYALLLLAPITYLRESRRNFFIDHIALFGLRTAILLAPNKFVQKLLQHAFRFVHSQSYVYANPFLAAMARECGVLPKDHRKLVLYVHADTNPYAAVMVRRMDVVDEQPSDFSTHSADEFMFDELLPKGTKMVYDTGKRVWLNGLCLCRSLLMLK